MATLLRRAPRFAEQWTAIDRRARCSPRDGRRPSHDQFKNGGAPGAVAAMSAGWDLAVMPPLNRKLAVGGVKDVSLPALWLRRSCLDRALPSSSTTTFTPGMERRGAPQIGLLPPLWNRCRTKHQHCRRQFSVAVRHQPGQFSDGRPRAGTFWMDQNDQGANVRFSGVAHCRGAYDRGPCRSAGGALIPPQAPFSPGRSGHPAGAEDDGDCGAKASVHRHSLSVRTSERFNGTGPSVAFIHFRKLRQVFRHCSGIRSGIVVR